MISESYNKVRLPLESFKALLIFLSDRWISWGYSKLRSSSLSFFPFIITYVEPFGSWIISFSGSNFTAGLIGIILFWSSIISKELSLFWDIEDILKSTLWTMALKAKPSSVLPKRVANLSFSSGVNCENTVLKASRVSKEGLRFWIRVLIFSYF